MTIDEAILLERETARRNKMILELDKLMQESHAVCCDKLKRETSIRIHEQLAEWLEELKKRRSEDYGYMADIHQSIGYRKAIDDFVETLVSAFDETNIKEYGFYPENLVRQVAKQLKAGGENEQSI